MGQPKELLIHCTGFDWDDDNAIKNWDLHQVTPEEAEELFLNHALIGRSDIGHSEERNAVFCFGSIEQGRLLFAAFTIRKVLIRVISVRDVNRKEGAYYESHEKENS